MKTFLSTFLSILLVTGSTLIKAQPFEIGHTQITFQDPDRGNRNIQTEIYYPANTAGDDVPMASGEFPVIIFGHGFVMVWSAYQNQWENFVPRGYIMAFPRTEGNIFPSHGAFGLDLAFLVQAMQDEGSDQSSLFYNKVMNSTAIMGHSMGGGATVLAGENNAGIRTIVGLAPAETDPSAVAAAANVSVPAVVFSGESDAVTPPQDHHLPIYNALASNCKYFLSIPNGSHCYFANSNFNCDLGESNPGSLPREEQQDINNDFLNLWLDYQLKDGCEAFYTFLDSLELSTRVVPQSNCTTDQPAISQNGGMLTSTSAATYQWYIDGNEVNGANSQDFTPVQSGDYTVAVTYAGSDCPFFSDPVNVNITGTSFQVKLPLNIELYPLPAQHHLFVESSTANLQAVIYDISGQVVKEETFGRTNTHIDIATLTPGLYFINFTAEDGSILMKKFIKR